MIANYLPIGSLLAAFAILTGAMFITSRVPVYVRVGASTLAVVFAVMIWLNATALMGYPVAAVPHDGVVVSVLSDKPHGFVYAWVVNGSEPRAYRIAYDSEFAGKLLKAWKEASEGGGQVVLRSGRNGKGKKGDSEAGGRGSSDSHLQGDDTLEVEIDVVPLLPEKD